MKLEILSSKQINRIDESARDILERTGVLVPHPEALSRLAAAGARVDFASQMVRLPPDVVSRALASAGKRWTIFGRDRARTAEFGAGRRNYNSTPGNALWIEADGTRRYPTLADTALGTRFVDALPNVNIAGAMATPHELPPAYASVAVIAEALKNTTKPVHIWWFDRPSAKFIMEVMATVAGGEQEARERPCTFLSFEPISPLRFPFHGIDMQFETARFNLPICIGPMVQCGLSGPVTLAGTLVLETAELLASVCVTQAIAPGVPVRLGGIAHAFDMATTQMIFGGPEQALVGMAMTQIGRSYGLPVNVNVGLTDSKCVDAQAGMECAATLMAGAMAGADGFGDFGVSGVDQGASLDMLVMQDELAGYVERVMRGIVFDDDTLAAELIREVGPGGSFIDQPHTAEHFRSELWFPRLLDRQYYEAWMQSPRHTTAERCRERVDEIVRTHTPAPLDEATSREVDRIVSAARRELAEA